MRDETKNYKIKLKPISPIHIGTGEAYEPMNYVIDVDLKDGKDYMYVFDEFEFFKKLDDKSKDEFMKIASDTTGDGILKLQKFIKEKSSLAKKVSYYKMQALKNIAEDYDNKIGKVVQREGGGKKVINQLVIEKTRARRFFEPNTEIRKKVINQLVIEKTLISPNLKKAIIPGSSLKGAIATAFWEMKVIDEEQQYNDVKKIMSATNRKNPFSHLLISDSKIIKSSTFIDIAKNIKRNKISKDGLSVAHEVISTESEFEVGLVIKNNAIKIEDIKNACNDHYLPIFESQFDDKTDKFIKKELENEFIKKYMNFKPAGNQFLLRVGKHSGARAVTVDGERKILIMQGKGKKPKILEEETTAWLINKQPFGWLLCEILEEN